MDEKDTDLVQETKHICETPNPDRCGDIRTERYHEQIFRGTDHEHLVAGEERVRTGWDNTFE